MDLSVLIGKCPHSAEYNTGIAQLSMTQHGYASGLAFTSGGLLSFVPIIATFHNGIIINYEM